MKNSPVVVSILMLTASFLLLGGVYHSLPAELPVLRNPFAGAVTVAPKSAFIVFRVPLMNLTHALIAGLMLSHATDFDDEGRRASYSAFFSTVLFAIALKSSFEALEMSGVSLRMGAFQPWLAAGTAMSVAGGVAFAFVRGRHARLPWTELRLRGRDKV